MNEVVSGVWRVDGMDLRMPGGVYMPLSATVLRLDDRSLAIYSPVAFTDEQAAAIDRAGEVAHVIAPNLYHYLFAKTAHARWPRATLWASPSLIGKALDAARPLTEAALAGVETEMIAGAPKLDETVLFHRATGTLVCADFVFHVTQPRNLRTRFALSLAGVGGRRVAQSRAWRFLAKDKPATARSFDRILDWPIARLSPAHGQAAELGSDTLAARLRVRGRRSSRPPRQLPGPAPAR